LSHRHFLLFALERLDRFLPLLLRLLESFLEHIFLFLTSLLHFVFNGLGPFEFFEELFLFFLCLLELVLLDGFELLEVLLLVLDLSLFQLLLGEGQLGHDIWLPLGDEARGGVGPAGQEEELLLGV